tara:strand:+ start:81 stop:323 length:243 start_codon:yes stop_codon:yes gene_type:complete
MTQKFKLNDIISFMKNDRPVTKSIKGIAKYEGEISDLHQTKNAGSPDTLYYYVDSYTSVPSELAFESEKHLMESVFKITK